MPFRIGLLVPSTNTVVETDFQRVAQGTASIHSQRLFAPGGELSEEKFEQLNADIERGAEYLATAHVDVIAYACTSGSFYKGPGYDAELVKLIERHGSTRALVASQSVVAALSEVGAKRISVATPYPEWANRKLQAYFEAMGFEVLNVESDRKVDKNNLRWPNEQEPIDISAFATRVCRPEADALFCSCTAWRALEAAPDIERQLGKPVVTSNQALIWDCFRKLDGRYDLPPGGRLFEVSAPEQKLRRRAGARM